MYPKERGRTAGRACISCAGTNTTINLFIPLQRHLDVWHMGASAKKCASLKVWGIMPGRRLYVHVGLSQYELGTTASVMICSPVPQTNHATGAGVVQWVV